MPTTACDKAVQEAAVLSEEVDKIVTDLASVEDDLLGGLESRLLKQNMEEKLKYVEPRRKRIARGVKKGWEGFKQARVSFMLMNPMTHIGNITSTGLNVLVARPVQMTWDIALSKLPGGTKRSFREMAAVANGYFRGASDFLYVAGQTLNKARKEGAVAAEEFGKALEERGYSARLSSVAKSQSQDITILKKAAEAGNDEAVQKSALRLGASYLARAMDWMSNAFIQSPMSALQLEDSLFSMMSYRAEVQRILAREAFDKGLHGEAMDEYVVENWNRIAKKIRESDEIAAGGVDDRLDAAQNEIVDQAVYEAREATFTQSPETRTGAFLAEGKIGGKLRPGRGEPAETQLWTMPLLGFLVPFRSIIVNLNRQALSKSTLAPLAVWDKTVFNALWGKEGKLAQEAAWGRVAGAWTLLGGFGALVMSGGIKVNPSRRESGAQAEAREAITGEVGGTLEIMGRRIPFEALNPQLGIPLTFIASGLDAIKEAQYSIDEDPEGTAHAIMANVLGPFIAMASDQTWLPDVVRFVSTLSYDIQNGYPDRAAELLAQSAFTPIKIPDWMARGIGWITGEDVSDLDFRTMPARTYDAVINHVTLGAYSLPKQIGLFGDRIRKADRWGEAGTTAWPNAPQSVKDMLEKARFDRQYPGDAKYTLNGDLSQFGAKIPEKIGVVPIQDYAKERFLVYAGKARLNGNTMLDDMKFMAENKKAVDIMTQPELRYRVNKIVQAHRQFAKTLIRFDPDFKLFEKETEQVVKYMTAHPEVFRPQEVQAYMVQRQAQAQEARAQLAPFFIRGNHNQE